MRILSAKLVEQRERIECVRGRVRNNRRGGKRFCQFNRGPTRARHAHVVAKVLNLCTERRGMFGVVVDDENATFHHFQCSTGGAAGVLNLRYELLLAVINLTMAAAVGSCEIFTSTRPNWV